MNVTVLLCRNANHPFPVGAWGIATLQGMCPLTTPDWWNHMAISFNSLSGQTLVLDCTKSLKGTRLSTHSKFKERYQIVGFHQIRLPTETLTFERWAQDQLAIQYDSKQIWGLAMQSLGLISGNTIGHDYRKMICSELILKMLRDFGNREFLDPDRYDLVSTLEEVIYYKASYN